MKQKNIALALLSLAAVGMLGLSSCETMKSVAGAVGDIVVDTIGPADEVPARVVHASYPEYRESERVAGKGRGEIRTAAGWYQKVIVKAKDGKQYSGTIHNSSRSACVSTGDNGVAYITKKSKSLRDFKSSY